LKNDLAIGRAVLIDDVLEPIVTMLSICRNRLLSIPSKTGGRVPMAVATLVEDVVREEIHDALSELSETKVIEESKRASKRGKRH
jgi:hypothetical protein